MLRVCCIAAAFVCLMIYERLHGQRRHIYTFCEHPTLLGLYGSSYTIMCETTAFICYKKRMPQLVLVLELVSVMSEQQFLRNAVPSKSRMCHRYRHTIPWGTGLHCTIWWESIDWNPVTINIIHTIHFGKW